MKEEVPHQEVQDQHPKPPPTRLAQSSCRAVRLDPKELRQQPSTTAAEYDKPAKADTEQYLNPTGRPFANHVQVHGIWYDEEGNPVASAAKGKGKDSRTKNQQKDKQTKEKGKTKPTQKGKGNNSGKR